jgi:Beta-propeller repeat
VTKLNSSGTALIYSTYLGGSNNDVGNGIAVDSSGIVYATGSTSSFDFPTTPDALQPNIIGGGAAFFSKLNSDGSLLAYSTYLGGQGSTRGQGIAVDSSGNAYVTGQTASNTFPPTAGALQTTSAGNGDVFVSKIGSLYNICTLYDQTKSVKSGSTVPIKPELCDGNGNDLYRKLKR